MEDSSILKINNKIAAFGFRYIPPKEGSAGADKFAVELYPRLVAKGYEVTAYNRLYKNDDFRPSNYKAILPLQKKIV